MYDRPIERTEIKQKGNKIAIVVAKQHFHNVIIRFMLNKNVRSHTENSSQFAIPIRFGEVP